MIRIGLTNKSNPGVASPVSEKSLWMGQQIPHGDVDRRTGLRCVLGMLWE